MSIQTTANLSSESVLTRAKILAVKSGKSLRDWAGEAIEKEVNRLDPISSSTKKRKGKR